MFYIAFGQLNFGHAAALGALSAIDLIVDLFGRMPELPLHPGVRLQVLAKAQILFARFLAQPPDLHQIGDHQYQGTIAIACLTGF